MTKGEVVAILLLVFGAGGCAPDAASEPAAQAGGERDMAQAGPPFLTLPDTALSPDDSRWIEQFLRADAPTAQQPIRYLTGPADLDGDGVDEVLLWPVGRYWCGTGGCSLFVLRREGGALAQHDRLTVTNLPLGYFPATRGAWADLAVTVRTGAARPPYVARVPADDGDYALNPSVPPAQASEDAFEAVLTPAMLETLNARLAG